MKLALLIILIFCLFGCFSQGRQERKIVLINQSGLDIDSASIAVSSAETYLIKLTKLNTGDTITNIIPKNIPKSNKHDIMVFLYIYIKDHKAIYGYSYNDLASYLMSGYTIILNRELKLKWSYK